ncbi:TetR/AcrR family transcriptional regulator [Bizionia sp. KMM 8389]
MARKKEYNEADVIEKAMNLFWKNGYETTSMQMLEKEMGINKFSIYSSFGNKNGVFIESLKCYKQKLNVLLNKLQNASNGLQDIETYFYDFIEFTKETEFGKGCLIGNTANEIGNDADEEIKIILENYTKNVRNIFFNTLKQYKTNSDIEIEAQADYLIIAMFGLSSATKLFKQSELQHYITHIFKNI